MSNSPKRERLLLAQIRTDFQSPDCLDKKTVSKYVEAMRRGDKFPPVTVLYDGKDYYLRDGFHRTAAAHQVGQESIDAEVHAGTTARAILKQFGVPVRAEQLFPLEPFFSEPIAPDPFAFFTSNPFAFSPYNWWKPVETNHADTSPKIRSSISHSRQDR